MFASHQDYETAAVVPLALGFEIAERFTPARRPDRLAHLRVDLLALVVLLAGVNASRAGLGVLFAASGSTGSRRSSAFGRCRGRRRSRSGSPATAAGRLDWVGVQELPAVGADRDRVARSAEVGLQVPDGRPVCASATLKERHAETPARSVRGSVARETFESPTVFTLASTFSGTARRQPSAGNVKHLTVVLPPTGVSSEKTVCARPGRRRGRRGPRARLHGRAPPTSRSGRRPRRDRASPRA